MITHQSLCDEALAAITKVFTDTSIEPEETIRSLADLKEEIDGMIYSIRQDLRRKEHDP